MNILITGITGFVGSNLSEYLQNQTNHNILGTNLRNILADTDLGNVDVVIHLAGKAHDLKNVSKPEDYYQINFELTKNIYNSFLESSAQTFIFVSSVKAVADEFDEVLTENVIPNPQTHYGKSKLLAENYILENALPNKRVFILRPCIIHGKGNKGNLNLLYDIIKKRIPYPLGAFENRRSFLTISNLCFIIKEIFENKNIKSDIFNVADSEAISTKELICIMNTALNRNTLILRIPQKIIYIIAKCGSVLGLALNLENLNKLTNSYVVSNEKVISVINKELPYTTKEGLLKTFFNF